MMIFRVWGTRTLHEIPGEAQAMRQNGINLKRDICLVVREHHKPSVSAGASSDVNRLLHGGAALIPRLNLLVRARLLQSIQFLRRRQQGLDSGTAADHLRSDSMCQACIIFDITPARFPILPCIGFVHCQLHNIEFDSLIHTHKHHRSHSISAHCILACLMQPQGLSRAGFQDL
jgi:hypothetical protein